MTQERFDEISQMVAKLNNKSLVPGAIADAPPIPDLCYAVVELMDVIEKAHALEE
jgi:hypothetical protein